MTVPDLKSDCGQKQYIRFLIQGRRRFVYGFTMADYLKAINVEINISAFMFGKYKLM